MKILQVNNVYKRGSTGKITYEIHKELLSKGLRSVVCYGRGIILDEPNVYKTCGEIYSKLNHLISNFTGIVYGGNFLSTYRLISIIKKEKPDIVHLQCINGYFVNIYKLIEWLKSNKIKTVLTLHAEFMYTGGCSYSINCEKWKNLNGCKKYPNYRREFHSYFDRSHTMWKKMKNAFEGFDNDLVIVSVSPWLMNRAQQSSILSNKTHCMILNGVDTSIFYRRSETSIKKIKDKFGIVDSKIVLHVTPNFNDDLKHIKGGYFVIKLAEQNPDITFVVVGPKIGDFDIPKNIISIGSIDNQNMLAILYSMANITLLTSKRETFSMIVAESLCCGTPIIGFKAGAPEQITINDYSSFVETENINELNKELRRWVKKEFDRNEICYRSRKKYSNRYMCNNYINVYEEMLNGKKM